METYNIPFPELKITQEHLIREMGYCSHQPDDTVINSLSHILSLVGNVTQAEYSYKICDGILEDNKVTINSVDLNFGATIGFLLKKSQLFALFTATSGYDFEKLYQKFKAEGDMMNIYIIDVIGSLIAERAGDMMEKHLENEIGNFDHTNRLSPGYCGWHLTEQSKLMGLMGGAPCGIKLSESSLMTPLKSISGIIGIGADVNTKLYACHICQLTTCYKRKQIINKSK